MRRRQAFKRALIPDVRYNNELVARLINTVMQRGKKSLAQSIVYGAFDILKAKKADMEPLEIFLAALENAKPRLEVKSRRDGGATYQVPLEIPAARQGALAMRWIVSYARSRKGMDACEALAIELMDAFNNTGNAIKKRDDVHKMANANKAFAHYRWG
ncbi:MAG: 30S ribosomal protein S7 [Victivallales bacterium]|nr:30S ribosomal protein S7 [Victivallales bacterium]